MELFFGVACLDAPCFGDVLVPGVFDDPLSFAFFEAALPAAFFDAAFLLVFFAEDEFFLSCFVAGPFLLSPFEPVAFLFCGLPSAPPAAFFG